MDMDNTRGQVEEKKICYNNMRLTLGRGRVLWGLVVLGHLFVMLLSNEVKFHFNREMGECVFLWMGSKEFMKDDHLLKVFPTKCIFFRKRNKTYFSLIYQNYRIFSIH